MSYENVKLWFAKDEEGNIITIDDIVELNKKNTYHCPICGSDLTPKATKSKRITPHFAHVDASKCNSESQIHFWFKHEFLEKGDKFNVVSDKERNYVCKEVLVEQSYETESGTYRPDATILTECGKIIYFEMAFSNKKKVRDYLDIWLDLKNIVVEVDIKQLKFKDKIPTFKALFYDGKCFNTKSNDTYYNTIGRYKEDKLRSNVDNELKERIRKLDWFWDDVHRYKKGEIDLEYMVNLIDEIKKHDYIIIENILKRAICSKLYVDYVKYKNKDNSHYFEKALEKDSVIRKSVNKLNRMYKKIDDNYSVKLSRQTNYYQDKVWWNGKKRSVSRVDSYEYSITLDHLYNDSYYSLGEVSVTNKILEMTDLVSIVDYINNLIKNHKLHRKCSDCGKLFNLTSDEVKFYKSKDFELPKRCKSCRSNRKHNKLINKEE